MIDHEVYFSRLLVRDITAAQLEQDVAIAPEIDIDQLDHFPSILYTSSSEGQSSPHLWQFILTISIFGDGMDATKALMRVVYDIVHAWGADGALTVLEVDDSTIWITELEDSDLFSRLPSAQIDGRNVIQYVGSFALALRNK